MLIRIFLVVLLMLTSNAQAAFNPQRNIRQNRQVLSHLDKVEYARQIDRAVDGIIKVAVWQLRRNSHVAEAKRIEDEWNDQYMGLLPLLAEVQPEDIGDHDPLSPWLADVYTVLYLALGEDVCVALHLDDIWILNFGIPVVFGWLPPDQHSQIDAPEYRAHFVPTAGVDSFWVTDLSCSAATGGTGYFWLCSPAGMLAEYVTVTYIAPRYSDGFYQAIY